MTHSDVIITEWTKQYARQLQQTRERGGLLTSPPSSQLLTAELKLAEVHNVQSTCKDLKNNVVFRH